jgi:hypothetical protein
MAATPKNEYAYESKDASSLEASRPPSFTNNGEGTFQTSGVDIDHYKPIASYEGIHRYDPQFKWTEKEETTVRWKVSSDINAGTRDR